MNNAQQQLIEDKYGRLIHKIAGHISGDKALASHEDNVQDLWIAAMDAIAGYEKQNGGANGTFDEFWGTQGFDRYLKTCLWTSKNNKGRNITKKVNINRDVVSISEHEEVLTIVDESGLDPEFDVFIDEMMDRLTTEEALLLDILIKNPSVLTAQGKVKVSPLAKRLGRCSEYTSTVLDSLSQKIQNQL